MEDKLKISVMKICRVCLSESDEMTALTDKINGDRTMKQMLAFITNINIRTGVKFPKQVCSDCKTKIHTADEIKRRCIESETILDQFLDVCDQVLDEMNGIETYSKYKQEPLESNTLMDAEKPLKSDPICKETDLCNSSSANVTDNSLFLKNMVSSSDTVKQEAPDDFDSHMDDDTHDFDEKIFVPVEKHEKISVDVEFTHITAKTEPAMVSKPKEISCSKCDAKFNTARAYRNHQRKHNKDEPEELFECSFCMRKFSRKSSLTTHIKYHESKDTVKYTCQTCKREFKHQAFLDNHISAVHAIKQGLACKYCTKSFDCQEALNAHIETHKVDKKHQCHICNKQFVMLSTLKDHHRTHTGEKPYLCSICGKGFSQNTNLQQHLRRHQGLKPFKCEDCKYSFVSKGELEAHKRKHSGAHPFVCDDCGNGFTTSSSLVKHRRIHTGERPYACDLCPMKFAASGTLKNHRRTHTGEKPYQCSHCEKAFVQRNDLISHIRCHTGERPYVCSHCGQSFRKAAGLKTHVKMHSKEPLQLQRDASLSMLQGVNALLSMQDAS